MSLSTNLRSRPELIISDKTFDGLNRLANASLRGAPRVVHFLLSELDRAAIVAAEELPRNVVDIGSWVMFKDQHNGEIQLIRLMYPREADIEAKKISVLTPVGTALLGLAEGQDIDYATVDGRLRRLTVVRVLAGTGSPINVNGAEP